MTKVKITETALLAAADLADDDRFPIVDRSDTTSSSTGKNKQTTVGDVKVLAAEAARRGVRILAIGDSFVAQNSVAAQFQSQGILCMLEALSGGQFRFDHANNKGVQGETTTQMLARFDTDVTANVDDFDVLYVSGGRNDARTSSVDGDVTIANLSAICTQGRALGKDVWLELPNFPRTGGITTDTQRAVNYYVNQAMAEFARATPGVIFLDFWRDLVDPTVTTGAPQGATVYDNIHPSSTGAYRCAKRIIATVGSLYPRPAKTRVDFYSASANPRGNLLASASTDTLHRFSGTSGVVTSPATGSTATGWGFRRFSGTGTTAAVSKVTAAAGYDATETDKIVTTISSTGTDVYFLVEPQSFPSFLNLPGRFMEAEIEVEILACTNCTNLTLSLFDTTNYVNYYSMKSIIGGEVLPYANGDTLRLRTAPMPVQVGRAWGVTVQGEFGPSGALTARFSGLSVRLT